MSFKGSFGGGSGSSVSGGGSGPSSHPPAPLLRVQPSVAGFYDWSNNVAGCVQVRQYHQQLDQTQAYYQQLQLQRQKQQQQRPIEPASIGGAVGGSGGSSAQVFPVRRPSKATLTKMRQYYNPGVRLLQASRPADAAWGCQPTKGEQHLAQARSGQVGNPAIAVTSQVLFPEEEVDASGAADPVTRPPSPPNLVGDNEASNADDGYCRCVYDPRLYPVYTSRSRGPMCVVCKRRRHQGRHQQRAHGAYLDLSSQDEAMRAPPSTPRPAIGRTEVAATWDERAGRRATTLDVFLPNAEREPATPLPRPSCDSARSQRTLTSPEPPSFI